MTIRQNAFGDYLVYKNGVYKGNTLKIMGIHKVYNKNRLIGLILKTGNGHISYDIGGNALAEGEFETLLVDFFK